MPDHTTQSPSTRSPIQFSSAEDILAAIDRVVEADKAGQLRTLGAWSPGQIMHHVAMIIRFSYEGFPFVAPLPIRLLGKLIKRSALGPKPLSAGIKLRGASRVLEPDADVSTQEGAEALRVQLRRIIQGEAMTQASPVFGRLTNEQWRTLQFKHAALHMSFLRLGD